MNNMLFVQVRNAGNELGEKFLGILFAQVSTGQNVIKQLAAWHQL